MLKTSKITRTKSTTTKSTTSTSTRTKLKFKVIPKTSFTRHKLKPHRTNSIINKKLFKLHPLILPSPFSQPISTTTPFTLLPTLLSQFLPPQTTTTTSTLLHSSPPSLSSSAPTISTINPPHASLPRSSSSWLSSLSSLSKFISLPFATIFNLKQQSPQLQQQSSITSHLQQLKNKPFHSLKRPFQHKLLSQSNIFHSTKVQLKDANEHTTSASSGSNSIKFDFLTSNEFKDAMKSFPSHFQDDINMPLATFIAAVEEHYPSKPLASVANFIRANRGPFQRLFQHQIVRRLAKADAAKQGEILEIIFNEYSDIRTLISTLRDNGCTNKEIGSLLRKIYPQHFHDEINAMLSPKTEHSYREKLARDDQCSYFFKDYTVNGRTIRLYSQRFDITTSEKKPPPTEKEQEKKQHTVGAIADSIINALENLDHFSTVMDETQEHFLSLFEREDVQSIINAHPDDWYSNPIYTQQIFQIFEIAYVPLLHRVGYNTTITSRGSEVVKNQSNDLQIEIQSNMTKIQSYLRSQRENNTNRHHQQIIQPLDNDHLAMSYMQNLILCSVEYLKQRKFMNSQSSTDDDNDHDDNDDDHDDNDHDDNDHDDGQEDSNSSSSKEQKTNKNLSLAFKLLTGLSYNDFKRNQKVHSLSIHGPQGIGKSFLLLIMFLKDVYKASKDPQNNPKVLILTVDRPQFPIEQFQVEIHLDDDGQIENIFVRNDICKNFPNLNPPPTTSHYYDTPDSPNSRDYSIPMNQTPVHMSRTTTFIYQGVEIRLLSNQEHFVHKFDYSAPSRKNLIPSTALDYSTTPYYPSPTVAPSLLSTPTFIRSSPSYIQTILSLLKSSLYQHRYHYLESTLLLSSTTPTQPLSSIQKESIHSQIMSSDFYQNLQLLSCDDLIKIKLFDQWDNGRSIGQLQLPSSPNSSTSRRISSTREPVQVVGQKLQNLIKMKFPAFHYYNTYHYSQLNLVPIQSSQSDTAPSLLEPLIQQAFHLTDVETNGYIEQIKEELRLLPYVSSAPRSAMTLYSQLQQPTQSTITHTKLGTQLGRRDLFTRFVPDTFERIISLSSPPSESQQRVQIAAVTQFSKLSSCISPSHFFQASITETVTPSTAIKFQEQIEEFYQYYRSNTLQHYFSEDHHDLMSEIYDRRAKYRYYVDTRPAQAQDNDPILQQVPKHLKLESFPTSFNHSSPPISPIILLPVGSTDQYKSINQSITSSVEFIYHSFTKHNTRVNVSLATNGGSNYPAFDTAFIHLGTKSTKSNVIIKIKPLQMTTAKSKTQNKWTPALADLVTQLSTLKMQHDKKLTITFDNWFIISPHPVAYSLDDGFNQPTDSPINLPFGDNPINFIIQHLQYSPFSIPFSHDTKRLLM